MWVRTIDGNLVNLALATGVGAYITPKRQRPWDVRVYWPCCDRHGNQPHDVLMWCASEEQARQYIQQIANRLTVIDPVIEPEDTDGGVP